MPPSSRRRHSEYDVASGARVGWCARGMLARDAQNDPLARQYGDERDKTKPHRTATGAAIASSAVTSRDQTGRVRAVRAGRQWAGFRWLPTAALIGRRGDVYRAPGSWVRGR